jgi:hypothetical protein
MPALALLNSYSKPEYGSILQRLNLCSESEEMEVFALLQIRLASEMKSSQSLLWMPESRERARRHYKSGKIP